MLTPDFLDGSTKSQPFFRKLLPLSFQSVASLHCNSDMIINKNNNMETTVLTPVKTWVLDPAHSELSFMVKHLMIAKVKGEFKKFEIDISGEDFTNSGINLTIDAGSINTNDETRDGHLKSADFFDTEHHKTITFESTFLKHVEDDQYKLLGNLTIKEITNPVYLDVEFGGIGKDPWGNEKAAFSISGKISRSLWGLNWNAALEAGGLLVSDEVAISGEIQFVKQS